MKTIYYEASSKEQAANIDNEGNLIFVNNPGEESIRANGQFYDFSPKYWVGTKQEYDNISVKDENTLYLITA